MLSDVRIEPPVQTEYLRSGGATILTFMLTGDSREFFLCTVCDTRKDGCAAGEGHVSIQVAMEVEVALEDGIRDDSDQVDRA
jgi:hypothetical protein